MEYENKKKDPEISIIVPIYNVEKYLRKCIESIQKQTFDNIEIILVDDGSTDNSSKICDDFANRDKRIKVFHLENGGVSRARNYGMDKAIGKYIMF
ncbi:MAG: glycosyltransferase family 2 protein, partial [Intestinibacter sp.]|uniref:glycosyltransferase family 2 protein n=1 Tax=Intestinibacter sp. TaxID=1965304 RepID=UPI003F14C8D7